MSYKIEFGGNLPNKSSGAITSDFKAPSAAAAPSGICNIYSVGASTIYGLAKYLWSDSFGAQVEKIFNDPMEAILGVFSIPVQPIHDTTSTTIKIGNLDTGLTGKYDLLYNTQWFDFGSVTISPQFTSGNAAFLDYAPYTKVKMYLPYVGYVDLDTNEVMGSELTVRYLIDFTTGGFTAYIFVSQDGLYAPLYQYSGSCASQIPMSSHSYMNIVSGLINVGASVATTIITDGATAPMLIGAGAGAANTALQGTTVKHSGSMSGNAGATGYPRPFVVITRPFVPTETRTYTKGSDTITQFTASSTGMQNFVNLHGTDQSIYCENLSTLTGFCRVTNVDWAASALSNGSYRHYYMTKDEQQELDDLLAEGVYFEQVSYT